MTSRPLPRVMVAPNGARRGPADHPGIPMSVDAVVTDALACRAAGAGGVHAHVRDGDGRHVLDAAQYRQLFDRLAGEAADFYVQATSESAGRYGPADQRAFLAELKPPAASVSVREFLSGPDTAAALDAYRRADDDGVDIQHILYAPDDIDLLASVAESGAVERDGLKVLLVHGRYGSEDSPPFSQLQGFLDRVQTVIGATDWAVCSFGAGETAVLRAVLEMGGKVRVGFENNLLSGDGSVAASNADRVREVLDQQPVIAITDIENTA